MYQLDSKKLRDLMFERQVNGRDVSRATGMTPSTISELLHGKRAISSKSVGRLAKFFGVKGEELLIRP